MIWLGTRARIHTHTHTSGFFYFVLFLLLFWFLLSWNQFTDAYWSPVLANEVSATLDCVCHLNSGLSQMTNTIYRVCVCLCGETSCNTCRCWLLSFTWNIVETSAEVMLNVWFGLPIVVMNELACVSPVTKAVKGWGMWQQAYLSVHACFSVRGQLFIFYLQLSERRASCCAPTCASGAMAWTPRVFLGSVLTRRPSGGPPTSWAPNLAPSISGASSSLPRSFSKRSSCRFEAVSDVIPPSLCLQCWHRCA